MRTIESDLIAKEGWIYVLIPLALALAASFVHWALVLVLVGLAAYCVYFFRNPTRKAEGIQESDILCPADGTIIDIKPVVEPDFMNKECLRVTIFMSPFNVHVNRSPITGQVKGTKYHKGEFLAAFDEKASEKNERSALHVQNDKGLEVVFVQIAGWFARRILSYPKVGDSLLQGGIFGLIKFGSRMDVYFPTDYQVQVKLKQKVHAGQTLIARKAETV